MAFTYILECADGTFYTGWTVDLTARLAAHNAGTASKYTRCRLPARLAYFEEFTEKTDARKREVAIKRLSRREKEYLIVIKKTESCENKE
jgi:putative endonuclease